MSGRRILLFQPRRTGPSADLSGWRQESAGQRQQAMDALRDQFKEAAIVATQVLDQALLHLEGLLRSCPDGAPELTLQAQEIIDQQRSQIERTAQYLRSS